MIYIIHLLNTINDCVSLSICYPFRKKQPLKDIYIIILNDMGYTRQPKPEMLKATKLLDWQPDDLIQTFPRNHWEGLLA